MYSSAMLSDETFIDGQTFIEGEWISNWINKDKLIESYFLLKKMLDKNNLNWYKIKPMIVDFVFWFEQVFDEDWEYTKANMNIVDHPNKDEQFNKKFNLETIFVIAPDGTFLNPKVESLEEANWGYRDMLLDNYAKIKSLLD